MRAFRLIFTACTFFPVFLLSGGITTQSLDRESLYAALRSEDVRTIEKQIKNLEQSTDKNAMAFTGALKMKQVGAVKDPAQKLKLFKAGHNKLEQAIANDQMNAEYKFLRLIIQENAPRFLNYHSHIEEDSKAVSDNFKNFSSQLQQEILVYSKKSKALTQTKLPQPHE